MTLDGRMLDDGMLCLLFDEDGGEQAYILTEVVPFDTRSAAAITLAFAARKLGIEPPRMVWFDQAPEGDYEQMCRDELPVFRHRPVHGVAWAPLRLIGICARQIPGDVVEAVAHETFHAAGNSDEPAAVRFGKFVREALMPVVRFSAKPYLELAAA